MAGLLTEDDFWAGSPVRGRGAPSIIDSFGLHFSIENAEDWRSYINARLMRAGQLDKTITDATPLASPIAIAKVNHGGWVAKCPYGCGGAEYVDSRFPLFYCRTCFNHALRRPLKCQFPTKAMQKRIEIALLKRRYASERNWTEDVTPERLQTDNERHGVG